MTLGKLSDSYYNSIVEQVDRLHNQSLMTGEVLSHQNNVATVLLNGSEISVITQSNGSLARGDVMFVSSTDGGLVGRGFSTVGG